MSNSITYAPPTVPARQRRITWQMVAVVVMTLAIVSALLYPFVQEAISGGIRDVGNGFKEVNLQQMSLFTFDQIGGTVEDVPKKWRDLDGQKIVVYGEIWQPLEAGEGRLGSFDLCFSIAKCCFTGPPRVQHFVKAHTASDANLSYYPNLVKVSGILHVNIQRDKENSKVASVYQMDVTNIEPM